MKEISRRTVLVGTASFATAAIAGCVSGDDDGNDGENDDGNTGSGDSSIDKRSITLVGTDCAGRESDTATVVVDGSTYTVEGTLPSTTPCYTPELVESSLADGTLSLTVDVVEDGSETCTDCTGEVRYDATVELSDGATVETVSVSHESGETHTIEQSAFVGGYPEITASSIETTQTGPRSGDKTGDAELDIGAETVTITGQIMTSTPHYEAVLEAATIERRELDVTVAVESTLEEDEVGSQPLGVVEYEATVEMDDIDSLTGATVRHPNSTQGFAWEEDSASASGSSSAADSTRAPEK